MYLGFRGHGAVLGMYPGLVRPLLLGISVSYSNSAVIDQGAVCAVITEMHFMLM